MVLAGNKCDLEDERVIAKSQAEQLSKRHLDGSPVFETSAKENINVEAIFTSLVQQIEANEPVETKTKKKEKGGCVLI